MHKCLKPLKDGFNIISSNSDKGAGVIYAESFGLTTKVEQTFQRKLLVWLRKNT